MEARYSYHVSMPAPWKWEQAGAWGRCTRASCTPAPPGPYTLRTPHGNAAHACGGLRPPRARSRPLSPPLSLAPVGPYPYMYRLLCCIKGQCCCNIAPL